jgi:hypothetical protein
MPGMPAMAGLQRAYKVSFILSGKCDMKCKSVNREKKIGITLIVFGICFPLILLPFVSGYEKDKGIIQNLFNAGIALKKEKPVTGGETAPSPFMKIILGKLPYRFILASGIFLIFTGILKIDISRRKDSDQNL